MAPARYPDIAPLVAETRVLGATLEVLFRCPERGTEVFAAALLQPAVSSTGQVAEIMEEEASWSVKNTLARTVRSAVTQEYIVVEAPDDDDDGEPAYTEAERQQAVVDAFESVSNRFVWQADRLRYVSVDAAGATQPELVTQLQAHPIRTPYDRRVFARMLAEIAIADGVLADDERNFFSYFITADMGSLDSLLNEKPLTDAELKETTAGPVRDTMLMLAWSLAMADRDIAGAEVSRLESLEAGLGVAPWRAEELKRWAQFHVVDMNLVPAYSTGERNEDSFATAAAAGRAIGLTDEQIATIDARFRARHGIT